MNTTLHQAPQRTQRHRYWAMGAVVIVFAATIGVTAVTQTSAQTQRSRPLPATARAATPAVRLGFEANVGQADPSVRFLSRGGQAPIFLTALGGVMGPPGLPLRVGVVGARPGAGPEGVDRLPGVTNDLTGNDPTAWHRAIPSFGSVAYRQVLPGVDLVFHAPIADSTEYDILVSPGTDPSSIVLEMSGATSMALDAHGEILVMHTAGGDVRQHKPVVYQEVSGHREAVSGAFRLIGPNRIAFRLGRYDPERPLVIDPIISYSFTIPGTGINTVGTGAGASGFIGFGAVAVDASGHAYVTGSVGSTDLPSATPLGPGGGRDAFVAKLNAAGTALDYVTIFGGRDPLPRSSSYRGSPNSYSPGSAPNDTGVAIAVDAAGRAYVAGSAGTKDFPTTANAYQPALPCRCSGLSFVTVLDAVGANLQYSTYLGGTHQTLDNVATGIAVDTAGKVYVVGQDTYGDDFPITPGAFQGGTGAGYQTGYVVKLDVSGAGSGSLTYSTMIKDIPCVQQQDSDAHRCAASGTFPNAVAVDAAGFVYMTGSAGCGYWATAGVFDRRGTTSAECSDFPYSPWVTKLNQTGTGLVYSTRLGARTGGAGKAIAVDAGGNAYVTGRLWDGNFPMAGIPARPTTGTGFFSRINADATVLTYSTYLDGDSGASIGLDVAGNTYVAGASSSASFSALDPVPGQTGQTGAFITKYDATGAYVYSSPISGEPGVAMAVDAGGAAYLLQSGGVVVKVATIPVVSSVAPSSGPSAGGTSVTITGLGFGGATSVAFGSDPPVACGVSPACQPDAQNPATTLHVIAPAHLPGAAAVSVTTPTGTSVVDSTTPSFTWSPPVVTSMDVTSGPATGGTVVSLGGSDLQAATVAFGGVPATSVSVAPDGGTVTATTAARSTAGPVPVEVAIAVSGATAGAPGPFTYVPAITGLLPASGKPEGGDQVLVVGEGFVGATAVRFGTDAASEFVAISGEGVAVVTPPHAAQESVPVTVVAQGLDSVPVGALANLFTYGAAAAAPADTTGVTGFVAQTSSGPGGGGPATPGGGGGLGSAPAPSGLATPGATPAPASAPGGLGATSAGSTPAAVLNPTPTPSALGTVSAPTGGGPGAVSSPAPGAAPAAVPPPAGAPSGAPAPAPAQDSGESGESAPHYSMTRGDEGLPGAGLALTTVVIGFSCLVVAQCRRAKPRPRPARSGVPTSAPPRSRKS